MTGLRHWGRDPLLPGRGGDHSLCAPQPEAIAEQIAQHLARPGAPLPERVTWSYARWKPGVSLCAAYDVVFADGARRTIGWKRYADGKAQVLSRRADADERWPADDPLRPSVVLSEERLHLWVVPHDRELPGLVRVQEMPRTRRLLEALSILGQRRMRSHRSSATLLRYRPERRAIVRLDVGLKDEAGQRSQQSLAVRVLPPAVAARVAHTRRACGPLEELPPFLGAEVRTGLLFEGWLAVRPYAPDAFGHAAEAGRLLGRLHALERPPGGAKVGESEPAFEDEALLEPFPRLAALAAQRMPLPPRAGSASWIHGDFHPDQVAQPLADGPLRLLDLDELRPGDPLEDLASWIADHLAHDPASPFEIAAGPLLDGWRAASGRDPDAARLAALVASALVARAAAVLRRLQEDAEERAAVLLGLARAPLVHRTLRAWH